MYVGTKAASSCFPVSGRTHPSVASGTRAAVPQFPCAPLTAGCRPAAGRRGGAESPLSSYLLRASLRSYPSEGSPHGTVTPPHASSELGYRSPVSSQMPSAHSTYQNSSPSSFAMVQGGVPGSAYTSPDYPDGRAALQPDAQARPQPHASVGAQVLPGSPRTLHRTVATNTPTPPSPGFGRRAVSPSLSSAPGSPGLGRHAVAAHSNLVAPAGSPSLGRHQAAAALPPGSPLYGYASPEERRPTVSRQSSSSGYQPPSTPSFPVSPAYYPGTSTPHSSSPDSAAYCQGSPTPQPLLPEKRRMSAGDRSHSLPSYATLNGKASSPLCSPSPGAAVAFSHTLPDFSKFSMPGKGCLQRSQHLPALPRPLLCPLAGGGEGFGAVSRCAPPAHLQSGRAAHRGRFLHSLANPNRNSTDPEPLW